MLRLLLCTSKVSLSSFSQLTAQALPSYLPFPSSFLLSSIVEFADVPSLGIESEVTAFSLSVLKKFDKNDMPELDHGYGATHAG